MKRELTLYAYRTTKRVELAVYVTVYHPSTHTHTHAHTVTLEFTIRPSLYISDHRHDNMTTIQRHMTSSLLYKTFHVLLLQRLLKNIHRLLLHENIQVLKRLYADVSNVL